ncbi:ElyC/SanA/YdcF family protein [Fibrobacter sp. UWB10]|uniref:ElyC/SanA/YdcF family protein n=1 Tax=Fibrobacter sp. UWB10 TaxID=1896201 RepID=UPI0024B7FB0C|nr:ElyC/SanA/YdcF family protein [Fibrobacter sp. UWB10]
MAKLPTKKQIQKKRIIYSAIAAAFVLMVIVFYMIMTHSGHWLVDDDEFEHVKWAVVLDGQSADMERIDLAADLVASGKVDSVLILGRRILRTRSNAEFYLEDFLRLGQFDSNAVFIARHDDPSTIGEAFTIVPWLKKHNADTVLLITGAAATHRVKRIFQTLSGDTPIYLTTDVHHYQYNADSWYSSRESRKEWLRNWLSLAASYFDLLPTGILTAADSFYYRPIVSAKEYENEKDPIVDLQSLLPKVKEKAEPVADTTAKDTTAVKNDSTASKKDSSK